MGGFRSGERRSFEGYGKTSGARGEGRRQQVREWAKGTPELLLLGEDVNFVLAPRHDQAFKTEGERRPRENSSVTEKVKPKPRRRQAASISGRIRPPLHVAV